MRGIILLVSPRPSSVDYQKIDQIHGAVNVTQKSVPARCRRAHRAVDGVLEIESANADRACGAIADTGRWVHVEGERAHAAVTGQRCEDRDLHEPDPDGERVTAHAKRKLL